MKKITFTLTGFIIFWVFIVPVSIFAQEQESIELLSPDFKNNKPLMQVLQERKSERSFSKKELSFQVLSNLLWAAFGINRPESGKRTAPSANNWQEIDIYVALEKGLYLYNAQSHMLHPVLAKDIRAVTGKQSFVKDAPVNLIYVADYSKMGDISNEMKHFFSGTHMGFIGQNVYLFCASEGLSTVVRGLIDRDAMAKEMKLRPDQKIVFAQTVGYPSD